MKKMILSCLNRIVSLSLMIAVLTVYSTIALALPDNKTVMGELVVTGQRTDGNNPFVVLNGEHVTSGNTVFSSSTIATTEFSSATVELGKLGYVSLAPNSVMSLNFDKKSITGTLSAGSAKVFNNKGVLVKIQTPNGVLGNEASNLESETTNASAEENGANSASGQTQKTSNLPYVLLGVGAVVAAVAILALSSSSRSNNNTVSPTS
jgi:hypothetical protein